MTWTVRDQVKQLTALNHNQLQSMKFMIKGGHFSPGEVDANMKAVDARTKRITLLKTYNPDSPYTG